MTIPYTTFKDEVAKGNVQAIYSQGASIEGRFKSAVAWPPPASAAASAPRGLLAPAEPRPADVVHDDAADLRRPGPRDLPDRPQGRDPRRADPAAAASATLLFGFGPALLLIAFYVWMYRRAQQLGGGIGRRPARHRQEPGAPLRPGRRPEGHLRGRRRHRRGRERAGRDRRLPEGAGEVHAARRHRRRRACCWSARRARARPCWRRRWPARPACRSSR